MSRKTLRFSVAIQILCIAILFACSSPDRLPEDNGTGQESTPFNDSAENGSGKKPASPPHDRYNDFTAKCYAAFDEKLYIRGIGAATGSKLDANVIERARVDARGKVAQVIQVEVKGEFYNHARQIIDNEQIDYHAEVWKKDRTKFEMIQEGCDFPGPPYQYYDETTGTLHLLAVMEKEKAAAGIVRKAATKAADLERVLEDGERAWNRGDVPAALTTLARVQKDLPNVSKGLPVAWFLVRDHPGIDPLLEKIRHMGSRCRNGQEKVVASLELEISQIGEYLSRESSEPVRAIVKVTLSSLTDDTIAARGIPMIVTADREVPLQVDRDRTGSNGSLSVNLTPADRSAPLDLHLTAAIDPNGLDALPIDLATRLPQKTKRITFQPPSVRKVLAGAKVTYSGVDPSSAGAAKIKAALEAFLLESLVRAGLDVEPLSSIEGGDACLALAPLQAAERLGGKGRMLCTASIAIEVVSTGAFSAAATWKDLTIIDIRSGKAVETGLLRGRKGKVQWGADAEEASRLAFEKLLEIVAEPVRRTVNEKCQEQ